ncbi:hypothetical protein ACC696_38960, partial [Rhizobium ruizarguesonis]
GLVITGGYGFAATGYVGAALSFLVLFVFAMTPLGLTLKPVIQALAAWGEDYVFCSPEGRELRLASDGLRAPVAAIE